jgi:transcriptional regulator with XRE-family HTH domain
MTIQDRLKQIIKNKRLKITEFANICDIPYRSVQGYLRGERMLGGNTIIKICTQLNINPNWLLMGQGEIYREEQPKEKITTFKSKLFLNWLNQWWENADEKHRNWLEIQLKRCFPEYTEWLSQQEKG